MRARVLTETRALWHLAWPILVGQLANIGMAVVDVAMAGHASANDLAGVSLGVSIWNMAIITIMGTMMSINPVVAQHVGARAFDKVPHVVRQGLWKALGVGLIALVVVNLASRVFDAMALDPVVRTLAQDFVLVTSLALPAFTGYRVLYGYSTSVNQTKPLMVISLVALLLNGIVNWLLVFGHLGWPRLGGLGCAWATLVCVWFNFFALLWWMHRAGAYRATWPFGQWEGPHWPELRALLRLGLPIGVTYFAETSAFSLIALLVAGFGSSEVAAHQIALNFTSLVFMVPLSLGIALLTRVGQSLGAADPVAARFRAWVGVGVSLVFAVVSATGMAVFNTQIANAYTSDAAVAGGAAAILVLAAIFQLSDSAQVVTSCAVRGYKVTRIPMVIHLTAFWVVSLPLGYVLGLAPDWMPWRPDTAMGARGFWIALVVGLTVAATGLLVLLHRVSRAAGPAIPPVPKALPHPAPSVAMSPALVVLLMAMLLGLQPVTTDLYLPALPGLTQELQASMSQAQLTLTALLLTFGISQIVWGPLSDRFGRRPILLIGMVAYVVASLASALVTTMDALIAWRAVQGAAMGAGVMCARAILRDLYQPEQGASVMSKGLSGLGVIACIAAPLGGFLTAAFNWHAALLALAVFGAATLVLVAWRFEETVHHKNPRALEPATLLRTWIDITVHPTFRAFALLSVCAYGGLFTFLAASSFVFIRVLGYDASRYGWVLLGMSTLYLGGTFLCRRLLLRLGVRKTVAWAGGLSFTGGTLMGVLALAGVQSGWAIIIPQGIFMVGHGIHQPCGQSGAVGPFPKSAGAASALNGFVMMAGAFGMGQWLGTHMDGSVLPLTHGMWFWGTMLGLISWTLVQRHGHS